MEGGIMQALEELRKRLDVGLITQEEFEGKREALLSEAFRAAEALEAEGTARSLEKAIASFDELGSYNGADGRAEAAKAKLEAVKMRAAAEKAETVVRRKGAAKRVGIIGGAAVVVILAIVLVVTQFVLPRVQRAPFEELGVPENLEVGDVFEMGTYEQDNAELNGAEPIQWRVIAVRGHRALAISVYGLDAHAFNRYTSDGNDWDDSGLKAWLQGKFAETAGLSSVSSRLTCLSTSEAENYFRNDDDRICNATRYAQSRGVSTDYRGRRHWAVCNWWLRTSVGNRAYDDYAVYVNYPGSVFTPGHSVETHFAVRPAIWVNM